MKVFEDYLIKHKSNKKILTDKPQIFTLDFTDTIMEDILKWWV